MNAVTPWPTPSPAPPDDIVLSGAFQMCPEGLAVVEGGRILYANGAFARIFQCRAAEMEGRVLAQLVAKIPTLAMVSGECYRVQGREFTVVLARASAGTRARGQKAGAAGAEAVGRLVSGVAHDFNNLLTGILLYCDLLSASLEGNPRVQRQVKEMRAAGEQGGALIQQLLTLARNQGSEARPLSWNDAICGLRNFLQRVVGEQIELITDLAPDLEPVEMDPGQMQQVILNLVLNARDAMPDGGAVTLATRNGSEGRKGSRKKRKGPVEFMVSDNGCGMDEATRTRIFEPFFSTKGPGRGNGLGLATVRNIVAQYGGIIKAESAPGQGTKMMVRLPGIDRGRRKSEDKGR